MDCQLSTSPLPAIWVIETLARSNQVDVSLLLDLLEKYPQIGNDLGKNARELVSLRILESFLVQGAQSNSVSLTSCPKIGFDPSECCEDVLQRILVETPGSNKKSAGPEIWKWDIEPFIVHKRSSLGKYSLQKLKDAILTGNHSFLASLKEQIGLSGGNQPEFLLQVHEDNCNGITRGLKGSDTNTQIDRLDDQLISAVLENGSYLLDKDLPDESLLPVKRKRSFIPENRGKPGKDHISSNNGCKTHMKSVKKYKHNIICSEQDLAVTLISLGENEGLHDLKSTKDMDKFEPNFQMNIPDVERVEEIIDISSDSHSYDDGRTDIVVKKNASCDPKCIDSQGYLETDWSNLNLLADISITIVQSSDILECRSEKRTCLEGMGQNGPREVTSSEGCIGCGGVLRCEGHVSHCKTEITSEKLDEESRQDHGVEIPCHLEGFHELKTSNEDIDKSVQNIQRNVINVGETEEDVDISSDGEVYHHEMIDIVRKKNDFLTSQCAYNRGASAATDRRELNVCVKCNRGGKLLVCSSNSCPLVIHEMCLRSDASFDSGEKFYCPFCAYSRAISKCMDIKKKVSLTRKDFATFVCWGSREEPKRQSRRYYRIRQRHLEQDDGLCKSKEPHREQRRKLENEQTKPSALSSGDDSSESGKDVCKQENEYSATSKYFVRVQKRKIQYSYPATPRLRRKRLPWTTKEEEALKEAMRICCHPHDRFIPWKKILELGANVFQDSRSTIDLKDKWRNLCKASPKS